MKKKSRPTEQYIQEHCEMIGGRIWALRAKRGYSKDELAEIMYVYRSSISKIETGKC